MKNFVRTRPALAQQARLFFYRPSGSTAFCAAWRRIRVAHARTVDGLTSYFSAMAFVVIVVYSLMKVSSSGLVVGRPIFLFSVIAILSLLSVHTIPHFTALYNLLFRSVAKCCVRDVGDLRGPGGAVAWSPRVSAEKTLIYRHKSAVMCCTRDHGTRFSVCEKAVLP